MTPTEKAQLEELLDWMRSRKEQQISTPVDPASQAILAIPSISSNGLGATALTQSYSVVGGGGGTVTGPKAYLDTVVLIIDSVSYEIPFVAQP